MRFTTARGFQQAADELGRYRASGGRPHKRASSPSANGADEMTWFAVASISCTVATSTILL
jgi:hypothetical protein